jgi:hypothetical protein
MHSDLFGQYIRCLYRVEETHKDYVNLIRYENFVCRKAINDVLCLIYLTVLAQVY